VVKKDFLDRVVLITGSSRGIGRATAFEVAERGATVVLNGRNSDRLEETREQMEKRGYTVLAIQGDVSSASDSENLVETTRESLGRIDILINNAGSIMRGRFEDILPEVFRKVIEVNILGSVYPAMFALPYLKESKGSIVFISSLAGLRGLPMASPYCASKMSLTGLAESLKTELSGTGVHVGVIYVSFTENDPDKLVLSADGSYVSVAPHFQTSQARTARLIVRSIKKRKFKSVLTLLGKILVIFHWGAPWLVDILLDFSQKKMKKLYQ
jgi:NAD(P)-dependent dehydrogenase (short-subunit alcohol dehydrogenase family)